jgi:hypothetical protein
MLLAEQADGTAVDGAAVDGAAVDGDAADGTAVDGAAPEKMIAEKVAGFMPPPVPRLTDDDSEWNEIMAELGIEP